MIDSFLLRLQTSNQLTLLVLKLLNLFSQKKYEKISFLLKIKLIYYIIYLLQITTSNCITVVKQTFIIKTYFKICYDLTK